MNPPDIERDDELRQMARALFGTETADETETEPEAGTGNPVLDADQAREITRALFSS